MRDWMLRKQLKLKLILFTFICMTSVMSFSNAYAERLAVNSDVANIRSGPGTGYEVLWQVEKYTPMNVLDKDKSGKWSYIKDYEGTIGWISTALLSKMDTMFILWPNTVTLIVFILVASTIGFVIYGIIKGFDHLFPND